jgi:phospho-N-acetylmuramoyl-pentapeptide-transferase
VEGVGARARRQGRGPLLRDELQPGDVVLEASRAFVLDGLPPLLKGAAAFMGCVGFLWWNAGLAAKIFMGDTGSLALGGLLPASECSPAPSCCSMCSVGSSSSRPCREPGGRGVPDLATAALPDGAVPPLRARGLSRDHVIIRFWLLAAICCALGLGIVYSERLAATGAPAHRQACQYIRFSIS